MPYDDNDMPTPDRGGGELRIPHNATEQAALIFPILQYLVETTMSLPRIAAEVTRLTGIPTRRTDVSNYLRLARLKGYIQLCPPIDAQLSYELSRRPNRGEVHVVPTYEDMAVRGVAARGADLVLGLILKIAVERGEVHLGLGVGTMTHQFVACLVARLAAMPRPPRVVIHMLGPACSPRGIDPQAALFFKPIVQSPHDVIEFHSAPLVTTDAYDQYRQQPLLQYAFDRRHEIDITVSSLADRHDRHGHLRGYLAQHDRAAMRSLTASGWLGDFQLIPFAATAPLQFTSGLKPVTLFDIDEYVAMAATPGKHVVLLCGPCSRCSRNKAKALQPLLDQPALRMWNHLVLDIATARLVA